MRCSRSRQVSNACVQASSTSCAIRAASGAALGDAATRPVDHQRSIERHFQPLDACPGLIKEMIDGDPVNPGRERGVTRNVDRRVITLITVITFETDGQHIYAIRAVGNPGKLAHLNR